MTSEPKTITPNSTLSEFDSQRKPISVKYDQELKIALAAVRVAAKVCQSVQKEITTAALEKKDRSPVTVADFASQAVICRELLTAFPDDPVIGEEDSAELHTESGKQFLEKILHELAEVGINADQEEACRWIDHGGEKEYRPRFWTLDPIDGTKGFLRGEQYAVSLALIVNGQIEVALLGCPNLPWQENEEGPLGVLFYATRGGGAWQVPLEEDLDPLPIRISEIESTTEARMCESVESGHSAHGTSARVAQALGVSREPRRLDSQAKYAVVARGEADIYLRLPVRKGYREKIWDHAGGVLLVEEAGGIVTDVLGKPLEFNHGFQLEANLGVIVANPKIHSQTVEKVIQAREQNEAAKSGN